MLTIVRIIHYVERLRLPPMTVLNGSTTDSASNESNKLLTNASSLSSANTALDEGTCALSNIELERRAIRKKQNLKSVLTSIISTLVLLGVCIVAKSARNVLFWQILYSIFAICFARLNA